MQAATPAIDSDARIARLEGIIEQMDRRLASMETRMAALEARMTALESSVRQGFFWIVGIQITTMLALGALIIARL